MKIVLGHHGQPVDEVSGGINYQAYFSEEDESAALSFIETLLILFQLDIVPLSPKAVTKKVKLMSWTLAGVTTLADWIGSNQDFFEHKKEKISLEEYFNEYAMPGAKKAIAELEIQDVSVAAFQGLSHLFSSIHTPSPLQQFTLDQDLPQASQLHIFEDVTGAGKTEAALCLSHRLMDMGLASGLYIALPSMATANAMYERMAKAYAHLFSKSDGKKPSLILAHGARKLSPRFSQSIGLAPLKDNDQYTPSESGAGAWCNAWLTDNAKKAFLAEVGVGTLDQALLSILPARHQSLRVLGLRHKVLIVDEVHAYDPYMQKLLENLLYLHSINGGSAIILSATLPGGMRTTLVESFLKTCNSDDQTACFDSQKTDPYPLITSVWGNKISKTPVETRACVKRRVCVIFSSNFEEMVRQITEMLDAGRCICWIRNTVKDAVETFDFFKNDSGFNVHRRNIALFHSRYAMVDRQRIETKVLEQFGKKSDCEDRKGQLLIATQVVEQSLDLDFDCLISDLAPIDLLIQRAGRLCRHSRDVFGNISNLEERGEPRLFVFSPDPVEDPPAQWLRDLLPGTAAVYPHIGQLWRSAKILKNKGSFTMPDEARQLVEFVYTDGDDNIIPPGLERQSMEAEGEFSTQRGMGHINQLNIKKGYSMASASTSGGWAAEVRIPTRLGSTSVQCVLAIVEDEKIMPYADTETFAWSFSKLQLPEYYVEQIEKMIPEEICSKIEVLKDAEPFLKWLTIIPLTPEIAEYYGRNSGFYIPMEG